MQQRGIFLTGATGLLGQYLLKELLRHGHPVAVLARDAPHARAAERITELVSSWNTGRRRKLPSPRVLPGELGPDGLDVAEGDQRWLRRHCQAVIHSAASLSFRETSEGEPWRTNVAGTQSLLRFCQQAALTEWHHVSTAFVCGRRDGLVAEEDLDFGQSFHNAYEESKFQAEQLLRRTPGIQATIYRPAVIVGDSQTGHTSSFSGLYRFLELAVRLASENAGAGRASLPLRLPLSGDETWNLVPVNWVARAIVKLLARPRWHGRTFHLVSPAPVSTRLVRDVAVESLKLHGVVFAGADGVTKPSRLEELFLDGVCEYWPYFDANPLFTYTNTAAALPHLPAPAIDGTVLRRLIHFALANRWGRGSSSMNSQASRSPSASRCAEYIERIFPKQGRRSRLAREAGLTLTICIDVRGPGGGQWSCKWQAGELVYARPGSAVEAAVTYRTDTATFEAVVNGSEAPQTAFFERRIEIVGDQETALKLAVLFGEFLREDPTRFQRTEAMDATASRF